METLGLLVKKEKQSQEICIFKHLTTKYVIINMYMKFKQNWAPEKIILVKGYPRTIPVKFHKKLMLGFKLVVQKIIIPTN